MLLYDLDRTLFDTDGFTDDAMRALAPLTGRSKHELLNEVRSSYIRSPRNGMQHYDIYAHMYQHGLSAAAVEDCVLGKLSSTYLYFDADRLLQETSSPNIDRAILTYGELRTQTLKAKVAGLLGHISIYPILQPKGEYISENFQHCDGVLIDDRPEQQLGAGWTEVTIDRSDDLISPVHVREDRYVISGLQQVWQIPAFQKEASANKVFQRRA